MIYLNNAATSYPKLRRVKEAVSHYMDEIPEAQFRNTLSGRRSVADLCKKELGELLHIADFERIVFTSGATEAANLIINGLPLNNRHVLVTANEHNCVLRTLYNNRDAVKISVIPCDKDGNLNYEAIEVLMKQDVYAVFVNHCSNVTGIIQDVNKICDMAARYHSKVILDISQTAGCVPIDLEKLPADVVFFTCHKAMMGIAGLGGFYTRDPDLVKAVKFGGTGRESQMVKYSDFYDFEVGTQNDVAIAALCEGLKFVLEQTPEKIFCMEQGHMEYLIQEMKTIPGVKLYGGDKKNQGPVLSFCLNGFSPSDTGYILSNVYDIVVRTGFHCAPFIHEYLGTKVNGTVRISISSITRREELEAFLEAVKEICKS